MSQHTLIINIYAYNPNHIKPEHLTRMMRALNESEINVIYIEHYDNKAQPIYLVSSTLIKK